MGGERRGSGFERRRPVPTPSRPRAGGGEGDARLGGLDELRFLRAVCESLPDGLLISDERGRIFHVNPRLEELSGYRSEELRGRSVEDLVPEEVRAAHARERAAYLTAPRVRQMGSGLPLWLRHKDGSRVPVDIGLAPILVGGRRFVVSAIREDGARRRAEALLRDAEARHRYLVERIPLVTRISRLDPTSSTIYISPQVEGLLGYAPAEWTQDPELWVRALHPDDREAALEAHTRLIEGGAPVVLDHRMVARDGRVVWVHEETEVVRDEAGRPVHAQGILLDITATKLAEQELERTVERLRRSDADRRRLLAHLVHAQEEERARIASDIHDDSLQKVAALRLRLHMLREEIQEPRQIELLEGMDRTIIRVLASLRTLLFDLRPFSLEQAGLAAALGELLRRLAEEGGPAFTIEDRLTGEPPPSSRILCYRIAQEAITNARKHARAGRLEVLLASEGDGTRVTIRDDGIGFDPEQVSSAPGHMGLVEMRERAELAGGWLRISSAPGSGTAVEFWVPSRAA